MEKVFIVPKDLIGNMIRDFADMIVFHIENNAYDRVVFDFNEVSTIVTDSLIELSKLFKIINMLGKKVEIRDVPPHLALPLSSQLSGLSNLIYSQSVTSNDDTVTDIFLKLLTEEEEDVHRHIEELIIGDLSSHDLLDYLRSLNENE